MVCEQVMKQKTAELRDLGFKVTMRFCLNM